LEFQRGLIAPGVEREIEKLRESQKLKVTCVRLDTVRAERYT
jgi:hypothetical protein